MAKQSTAGIHSPELTDKIILYFMAQVEIYQSLLESFQEKKIDIPDPRQAVRIINQSS